MISLERDGDSGNFPSVQVWRPMNQAIYTLVGTVCALTANDIDEMTDNMGDVTGEYFLGEVSCTGNNRIDFQSGDVIGYHQGDELRYRVWNINAMGYTSYHHDVSSPLTTFNINNVDGTIDDMQPLIQVIYGTYV